MQLFYDKNLSKNDTTFTFDKTESRHIVRVLRKREGDLLHITNGKGFLFNVKIVVANEKKCLVELVKLEKKEQPFSYYLHIAIAPTKNNQRLEWFLEKATEIGISEITPIICENSERKIVKNERMEKVLISAMKQSNRFHLPILNEATTFKNFINKKIEGNLFIAHCEETKKESLKKTLIEVKKLTLLIGPEGDFSTNEIDFALKNNYKAVTLGNSRLRTETAGIVAVHSVAFINEF